jgi:hypothetical protein
MVNTGPAASRAFVSAVCCHWSAVRVEWRLIRPLEWLGTAGRSREACRVDVLKKEENVPGHA